MSAERATAMLEIPARGGRAVQCSECTARVCARVEQVPGVLRVECDAGGDLPASLRFAAIEFGAELEGVYEHEVWRIEGLDCPDCAQTVAKSVRMVPGVVSADLNFASGTLLVEHDVVIDPSRRRRCDAAGSTRDVRCGPRRTGAARGVRNIG